jgi:uncharacterized membrane protein
MERRVPSTGDSTSPWRPIAEAAEAWRARLSVERVYLVVALVWGIALIILVPPFQTVDEHAHYYRAWSVAQGQLVVPASGHVNLPEGADALPSRYPYQELIKGLTSIPLSSYWRDLRSPLGTHYVRSSSFAAEYGPIGYLPQAAGLTVIRLAGGSPLLALYAARLLNLVTAVLLTYFGLRLLPFGKLAVCFVALLPMTMMQVASVSPDAMILGACVFLLGLVVKSTATESLSRSDIALLVVAAVLLVNAKPGYAILSLLLLLLLPRQFKSRLSYAATVIGSIVASLLLALVFVKLAPRSQELEVLMFGAQNGLDPAAQLAHVVAPPLGFVRAVLATIGTNGIALIRQGVANYAWGNHDISDGVTLVAAVGVGTLIAGGESVQFAAWRRGVLLGVALLTGAVVAFAMYLVWTNVGATSVAGLQGRYFAPCVMLAFVGLSGFPFGKRWLVPLVIAVVLYILIMTSLKALLYLYY